MNDKFEYTLDGYCDAGEWLSLIGDNYPFEKGFSTDGYSVVHYANSVWERLNPTDED